MTPSGAPMRRRFTQLHNVLRRACLHRPPASRRGLSRPLRRFHSYPGVPMGKAVLRRCKRAVPGVLEGFALSALLAAGLAAADPTGAAEPETGPEVRPARADWIELGGYLQVHWNEAAAQGSFEVRRARVQLEGELSGELEFQIDFDLVDPIAPDDPDGGRLLKDIILEAQPVSGVRLRAGQFKKRFLFEEDTPTRELPVLDRGLLSEHLRELGYAGRDVGGELRLEWEASGLENQIWVQVLNGEGANVGRVSDGRADVVVDLAVERNGWGLEGGTQWRRRSAPVESDSDFAAAYMLAAWMELGRWRFSGEFLDWQSSLSAVAPLDEDRGWAARGTLAWSHEMGMEFLRRIELGIRGEYLEPNRSESRGRGDRLVMWTPTLALYPHGDSRVRAAPQILWHQDPAEETDVVWTVEWQIAY
ncbi:MAG: hypothetical protein GF355_11010 [Candidatus Eisenbacteria bacterium]|nr:hypothetical protein [Candidatus Eisenbacteria bacterium]